MGQPLRQWPNFLHAEHWFRAKFVVLIYGALLFLTGSVDVDGARFELRVRLLLSRFFLRFFLHFLKAALSDEEEPDEDEGDDDRDRIVPSAPLN